MLLLRRKSFYFFSLKPIGNSRPIGSNHPAKRPRHITSAVQDDDDYTSDGRTRTKGPSRSEGRQRGGRRRPREPRGWVPHQASGDLLEEKTKVITQSDPRLTPTHHGTQKRNRHAAKLSHHGARADAGHVRAYTFIVCIFPSSRITFIDWSTEPLQKIGAAGAPWLIAQGTNFPTRLPNADHGHAVGLYGPVGRCLDLHLLIVGGALAKYNERWPRQGGAAEV